LQGKVRSDKIDHEGVLGNVKTGVRQVFERFDLEGNRGVGPEAAVAEVDQRLEWFAKKVRLYGTLSNSDAYIIFQTIPALLRSAVSRQNTLIVVPSYFDYIRVVNHLRKADVVSYSAISE